MDNLTVVVPYRDNRRALEGLLDTLPEGLPLVVVDDCSTVAPPVTALEARPSTRLIRLEERGYFSGAVNAGIAACETDVLVLNQDVRLVGGEWWAELEELRGEFACIGDGVMDHPAHPNGYVQGTCMFLRRDALEAVGLFDAVHWPLWGATAEWQLRACRRGFRAMPIEGCDWFTHSRRGAYGSSIRRLLEQEPE
ncbi:MAG: glycosyltransferase, partial [Chloroflexi bacterium]|nr:glycosyltransferase [Chloroflexota bacterium]